MGNARFISLLAVVIAASAITVWLGYLVAPFLPALHLTLLPLLLAALLVARHVLTRRGR